MTSINLTKKQLIDVITVHYLKQGKIVETNLKKISKNKLRELINEEEIPVMDNQTLQAEIKETEEYTNNLEIIYYNFLRYKRIPVSLIIEIKNNQNLTSRDLWILIENHKMIVDDIAFIKKTNKMILSIASIYNNYCNDCSTCDNYNQKWFLQLKTIPDIINSLSSFSDGVSD